MSPDLRKFLIRCGLFSLPFVLYLLIAPILLPKLLGQVAGPSTEEQILYSTQNAIKKEYDLLILGNSRVYRGLNPDKFSIPTYNYAHDNDAFNQVYYKLNLLEKKGKKFKILIVSVDYFGFSFLSDTRNYVYGDILGEDYLLDFPNKSYKDQFEDHLSRIHPRKLIALKVLLKKNRRIPMLKENGQYLKHGYAGASDRYKRNIERLPIQIKYFLQIIDYCQKNNIKLYLLMCPVRAAEKLNYTDQSIEEFRSFMNTYHYPIFLDFSNDPDFELRDFTDITHLNLEAADRFSSKVNAIIIKNKTN